MNEYIKIIYKFLSSVKLALGLISTITLLSIIGMLVPQSSKLSQVQIQAWQNNYPILSKILSQIGFDKLFSSKLFLVIALLFLINTFTCTIKQIEIAYKLWIKGKNVHRVNINNLKNSFTDISHNQKVISELEALLSSKGFKYINFNTFIYGYKRSLGYWGSSIFHIGLVFIILGVFISFAYKTEGRINITEGQTIAGTTEEYIDFKKGPLANVPNNNFRIKNEKVNTKIEKQIEDYSSDIVIIDNDGREIKRQEIKTNKNLKYQGYTYYPYEYGYSPAIIIDEKGIPIFSAYSELITKRIENRTEYSGNIKLNDRNLVLKISFIPNILKEGLQSQNGNEAILYDLKDTSGKSLYKGSLNMGKETKIGDLTIKFPEYRKWAGFIVVRDYGVNLIYLGGTLALIGLLILYFWVPQTIFINYKHNQDKTITLLIGGISKKYSISFKEEFQELKEKILKLSCGGENE